MRLLGLIGYPLGHSFSAGYFSKKFQNEEIIDCEYRNFPIEKIELIKKVIEQHSHLVGFNVTIPYKQQIIPFLQHLSDGAKAIGAVNTVKIYRYGGNLTLKGFNTDEYGFRESLAPHLEAYHNKALVLGTGGASKAVEYVLTELGIEYISISREPKDPKIKLYNQVDEQLVSTHKLIINTTPLGMFPDVDRCPDIPYKCLTSQHLLYDLVYNPEETLFMKRGKDFGAKTLNGLQMLQLQAEKAWQIWNDDSL